MEAFAIGAAAIIANVLDVSRIISVLTLQARKIFPEPAAAVPVGQKTPSICTAEILTRKTGTVCQEIPRQPFA